MGTVSAFPHVHLLLLLSIVLKRQTIPFNYKEHKPEIQRNKRVYNKSIVTSQPRSSQSPQSLGSLWKLEAAPFLQ